MNNADKQYLTLVRDILENGYYETENRTGMQPISFHTKFFNLTYKRSSLFSPPNS